MFTNVYICVQLFLDRDDLNAGLYEGEVRGRRRFGDTQVSTLYNVPTPDSVMLSVKVFLVGKS